MIPSVSILINTLNNYEKLRECISSIFGQTYSDFEIVIIDEGSTDRTKDFLDFIPDKRLHFLRDESTIPPAERLQYIACGKYLMHLKDDDVWTSNTFLAQQIALAESDSQEPRSILVRR